ncbi:MAG: ATP-dependent protease La [Oscillospiraceae bacterium]|nr:ATP-dependent protease La [Oscillospiraceae bacterium]
MEQKKMKKTQVVIPTLAMRGLVLFPNMVLHFDVGREKSILALNAAMKGDRKIFLTAQKDMDVDEPLMNDLYTIGVVAEIKQLLKVSKDTFRVLVEGLYKAKIESLYSVEPYLEAEITKVPMAVRKVSESMEVQALVRSAQQVFDYYATVVPKMPNEILDSVLLEKDPYELFDKIVQNILLPYADKQKLLETKGIKNQLKTLIELIAKESELLKLENDIFNEVKEKMDKNQRDYFLREQLKLISEQLGESENVQDEAVDFSEQVEAIKNISEESREKLMKECERLYKMPPSSHEANVVRSYLESCIDLPWDSFTKDKTDINRAKRVLDRDHFGMDKVKDRILESVAVRKLSPNIKGQILCLVGPPGVGKTSIAKAVAEALGRRYTRISLGGVRDESDIRGHRKTYIGAMPGRIIAAIKQAKSRNPLILLDEIDKMGSDFKGDPSSAMLEVLDSEQNMAFRDHYIEVPFDLSDVLFITTANTLGTIPTPLLDRMEVIELSSYTREEKFNIVKKHLLKKQFIKHGLSSKNFKVSDDALYDLIDHYTREAGVRKLERSIATLCRKAAKKVAMNSEEKVMITASNMSEYLGPQKYRTESIGETDEVGVVNGLAWTSVGGETMQVEVSVLDGTGRLELTGNLGDVMKESARTAVSFVRSIASEYGIDKDFYKTKDIHIHVPEGAVPKDGPSAGVTLVTALVSALSGSPVKRDVAMTGEVTLRGRVLAIGGLKEKTMAAYRAGVKTVFIPKENKPDLADFDQIILDAVDFVPVNHVDKVIRQALLPKDESASFEFEKGHVEIIPSHPSDEHSSKIIPC